ncbi:MAG: CocE/NonD family hydrolase, partial [Rhodanobacteraceae bacterium]
MPHLRDLVRLRRARNRIDRCAGAFVERRGAGRRRAGNGRLAMRKLPVLCVLLLVLPGVANASRFDPSHLAQDQGTYRFADGTCVTGGRMDEDGVRLLYMDVWNNRMGILLASRHGTLVSLFPHGFNGGLDASGNTLTLTGPDATVRSAHRLHRPDARAVRFKSGELTLAGTLYTPPAATGKLPAVVLAHGSGPVDRFGGPWITFFTNLGFAVLSYDKRGVGESAGGWHTATYVDLTGDLDAAVDWLARQPEVDPARLGIHSTSQSGWYAPLAAARDDQVRFLIQRVGPALWIGPVTQHENEGDWRAAGVPETDIAPAAALWLRLNTLARQG